jgi:hypothetical protein
MKKFYFLAVIALVAGVSCAKQVPDATQDKDVAISFSPVSQRVGTKANVYGEQNATYTAGDPTFESFAAWANYTAADHGTTNPQTDGSVFFGTGSAGVVCNHHDPVAGAGTDYWAPSTTYYWPRAGYLHFHAMSPAVFGTGTLAHSWASGISINNYVAPVYTDAPADGLTTDASQIDLMYSDFIFDKQRSSYTQTGNTVGTYDDEADATYQHDGVNVLFRHALSLVQFKVKTAADYGTGPHKHQFYVRKIEVLNAYNTGNFDENRKNDCTNGYNAVADMSDKIGFTSDNADDSATPFWTNFSNEVTLTPYDVTAGAAMTGTQATTSSASSTVGTTLITLPQALAHAVNHVQVQVTFDYRFSVDNGVNWTNALNQTITVDLSGAHGTYSGGSEGAYTVNNWLINHKYVYTLQFKLDPIIFDPAVEAFVTVGDITVDLPF